MTDFPAFLLPALWVLNGFLVVLYILAEHWYILALLWPLYRLTMTERPERQGRVGLAAGLTLLAALLSPPPVPYAVLLMAWAALGALALERHDPLALRWSIAQGLGVYALAGLGSTLWRFVNWQPPDPATAQGLAYLNAIIAIAMYAIPLGFLALLAQALWVHPPMERPEDIVTTIRTRGREQ